MRHRKSGIKLNRTTSHRDAMFRNMVTSLFKHDRIKTTDAKAKELRKWADHLVTLAKKGDLHARRQALSIVREKDVVHKLFEDVEDRFGDASGGYTRVVKLGTRPGDAASVSLIELVTSEKAKKKPKKKKKKKAKAPEQSVAPLEAAETAAPEAEAATEEQESAPAEEKAEAAAEVEAEAKETEESEPVEAAAVEEEKSAEDEPSEDAEEDDSEKEKPAE